MPPTSARPATWPSSPTPAIPSRTPAPPVARLIEGPDGAPRSLLDHDGSLHFVPAGTSLRVESPLNGHYLALSWRRGDVDRMLTDMGPEYFTLEPLGTERWCNTGDSVRLRLRYEMK